MKEEVVAKREKKQKQKQQQKEPFESWDGKTKYKFRNQARFQMLSGKGRPTGYARVQAAAEMARRVALFSGELGVAVSRQMESCCSSALARVQQGPHDSRHLDLLSKVGQWRRRRL